MNILREPNIILVIARACLSKSMLRVCQQWTIVLYATADDPESPLRDTITAMGLLEIPAAFWPLMSFKQRVLLPNFLLQQGEIFVQFYTKYKMTWTDVVAYCIDNPEYIPWLLEMWDDSCCVLPHNTGAYFTELFKRYEIFRRHIQCLMHNDWVYLVPYVTYRSSFSRSYGRYLFSALHFTLIPWSIRNSIDAELRAIHDALVKHTGQCECYRLYNI